MLYKSWESVWETERSVEHAVVEFIDCAQSQRVGG